MLAVLTANVVIELDPCLSAAQKLLAHSVVSASPYFPRLLSFYPVAELPPLLPFSQSVAAEDEVSQLKITEDTSVSSSRRHAESLVNSPQLPPQAQLKPPLFLGVVPVIPGGTALGKAASSNHHSGRLWELGPE